LACCLYRKFHPGMKICHEHAVVQEEIANLGFHRSIFAPQEWLISNSGQGLGFITDKLLT